MLSDTAQQRLIQATHGGMPCRVVYRDAEGVRTIREIRVRSVDARRGLVRCDCGKRRDVRTFRADRIAHVFPLRMPRPAPQPDDPFQDLF